MTTGQGINDMKSSRNWKERTRRHFLQQSSMIIATGVLRPAAGLLAGTRLETVIQLPLRLRPRAWLGNLAQDAAPTPLPNALWCLAEQTGAGLEYQFPAGTLAAARFLTADMLLDDNQLAVFRLRLKEGADGPAFDLSFGLLNQCGARLRLALTAVNQNRWMYPREGAWLKPLVGGQRVDLARVDRMMLTVTRKGPRPVRWCLTDFIATAEEPKLLENPLLPKGPLIDELGQSAIHDWPGKSRGMDEVTNRLKQQHEAAGGQRWPRDFSKWGGWTPIRFERSGFFRTHNDGKRWWLVDPDGYAFWSAGMDCVRVDTEAAYSGLEKALAWMPDPKGKFSAIYRQAEDDSRRAINYLAANFIRAFSPETWYERWSDIALAELRRLGFNTVANWSDWKIAQKVRFPYVRPLRLSNKNTGMIYRDFPDVFHPGFLKDCEEFADQLRETKGDPAFIGYFLMNEPNWGFSSESPAAGMLFTAPKCETRKTLAEFLRKRYESDRRLSEAWSVPATFAAVTEGEWKIPLTPRAKADLADFSSVMVEKLFRALSDACRHVDSNHLNLGIRYHTVPPSWALEGMRSFDVFSMNCYESRVRAEEMAKVNSLLRLPVLVGEWHFGALDAGLPATGIGAVPDQAARGKAFRIYTEDAAAKPWCVGVHYFTLYDQSALGRFDGENYNIGFLDVCNHPYEPLATAARASHERLYEVALGKIAPFNDAPEYLPKLFM